MIMKVNVGGVWKDVSEIKVNIGGSWKVVSQISVNIATAWKDVLASGPTISPIADGRVNIRVNQNCFGGVRWHSDGEEYEFTNTGGLFGMGPWLDTGLSSEVWVERIVTSGSWNSLDPGTGRHQLSTIRNFRIISTGAEKQVTGSFKFWDAASGGNLIEETASAQWTAEKISF